MRNISKASMSRFTPPASIMILYSADAHVLKVVLIAATSGKCAATAATGRIWCNVHGIENYNLSFELKMHFPNPFFLLQ